jgi:hypothetical protein
MRRFFSFWWLCVRTAFRGNSASANDWQWIFANPLWQSIGSAVGGALGAFISSYWAGAPLVSPETPIGVFAGGLFGFCATWLAFFLLRFLKTPPTLYYQQKDRADKLDGIELAKFQPSKDKQVATLQERYLSPRGLLQRGYLDHEADGQRAIDDVKIIFDRLTARTHELTGLTNKNSRRVQTAKDASKKRDAIKILAGYLDSYSDRIAEFAAITRALTPVYLECTMQFVERGNPREQSDFDALYGFRASVYENIVAVQGSLQAARNTVDTMVKSYTGVTHDLTVATKRMSTVMGDLDTGFQSYISACEQIHSLAERKIEDGKKNLAQAQV